MGNIIATKCKSCGFSNEFRYGGGRFSYQTNCPVPAINKVTLEFENIIFPILFNFFIKSLKPEQTFNIFFDLKIPLMWLLLSLNL